MLLLVLYSHFFYACDLDLNEVFSLSLLSERCISTAIVSF